MVIVDGQQGITAADESIAEFLRSRPCPTLLAVNKCESPEQGLAMAAEFWSLGLGEPHPISAIHGVGTGDLLDQVLTFLPPKDQEGRGRADPDGNHRTTERRQIQSAQCHLLVNSGRS